MELKNCRVCVQDFDGTEHVATVTAGSLFEAVALGLTQIKKNAWAAELAEGLNIVTVSVQDIPVEHKVRLGEFNQWLKRSGGSPADRNQKRKVKEILGLKIEE